MEVPSLTCSSWPASQERQFRGSLAAVGKGWEHMLRDGDTNGNGTPNAKIERKTYSLGVVEALQDNLKRRDIYVAPSERWADPRAKLLSGDEWEAACPQVLRTLELPPDPREYIEDLGRRLDRAYRRTADNAPQNAALRVVLGTRGSEALDIASLDKLEEPDSLIEMRAKLIALLPRIDLPELLLEVQQSIGFADEFTYVGEGGARVQDLHKSVCVVLIAEACNVGLEALVKPDDPALTRSRLSWVAQNYVRAETLTAANARLVDAQAGISG